MRNILKKFKIPTFFKTKKFFLLVFVCILFFLFTPISLHQIGKRVEEFINRQAVEGVQKFEKQTGLKIEWERLTFNILTMTVKLEDVKVQVFNTFNSQKIQALNFLNGLQKVNTVSARPSLYSLLFEKQIVLSKLQISEGDIYLRTLKSFLKKAKTSQTIALPIKKILIQRTNFHLKHQEHNLGFSEVNSKILQKTRGVFRFDLFVKRFRINKDSGFKEFQTLRPYIQNEESLDKTNNNEIFQLSVKGLVQKDKISFKNINLKNKSFQSVTDWLDVHFDSKGLKKIGIKSSGSLPFFLIHKGLHLMGKGSLPFDALLSYKLNIQYRKNKGYWGFFEVQGREAIFKSHLLKSFSLEGRLINRLLAVDRGLIETQSQGMIGIKKGEWLFKGEPFQFNFSVEADKLSSDFVTNLVFNWDDFPVKGDFTGLIHCLGAGGDFYLKCETEGKSERIRVQMADRNEIVSFYKMDFHSNLEWKKRILNFTVSSAKTDSPGLDFKGRYLQSLNKLEASYSFFGNLSENLKFNTPFPMEGEVSIPKGELVLEKGRIQLNGSLISPLLRIQSYELENISSLYRLENSELKFFNIKGTPGRTNYVAECDIDFAQKELILKLEFSFFDIENFLEAVKENISLPVKFTGTGDASFFMRFPWSSPDQKQFHLKGNLFNVYVDRDLFQQIAFDLGIQNKQGVVRSLSFKKGRGFIKGTGSFDENFLLDLDLAGQNLSLERLEWINEILPLNQSGDVNFNIKLTGTPKNPKLNGNVMVSNMFFYSYPVNNSRIKLKIDKETLSFSGNITNEIHIENFVYPFSKDSKASVKGQFSNLDFIKILFSKNHIEATQDYSSNISGSFSLSQNKKTQKTWEGFVKIDQFLISKYNRWIKNENPFSIFLNEQVWSFTPTRFSHYNNKDLIIEKRGPDKLFLSGETSLGLFSVFFPFFKEFDGSIKGQVLVDNNLKKLSPRGSLQIEKGLFAFGVLPDFTNIRASLILSKSNIFISDFTGSAGQGLLEGEGTVFYDFVNLPRLNLNLKFFDARLNIPKDFKTRGSGKMQIYGEKPPYLISGQYLIDSGNITKDFLESDKKARYDFSFLNKETKKQDSIFGLKLGIKTRGAVAVNSSLIRSSVEGQADIYGPLDSLLMDGQFVLLQETEENLIFFRGQEFKINSGSVLFKNSAPGNPYLNIQASTLFKESIVDPLESNQEIERNYEIFLSLTGMAKDPQFVLESVPSLNEKEIISLLTLGVNFLHFDENVNVIQNLDYSYQLLGSLLLEKPLNREIKNTLGLDFRLTPYINTLNEPVTKITLSRNWFEKWRTSFSRTIEDAQSDVRLKYDLNQKVSLTAFWENTGQIELEDQEDWLGLDLEFNFDF